jgi:hypothetical protein
LEGHCFQSDGGTYPAFPVSLQRDFRRLRVDINIILKESDESAKYELFERLNTGGSTASPQEVRNCVIVWTDETLYDWMKELCTTDDFTLTTPISDRLQDEGYRDELVLRVLTLGDEEDVNLTAIGDINAYLNQKNRALKHALPRSTRAATRGRFESTFSLISQAAGEDAFRRYDATKQSYGGPFLISAFEAIALGVWYNQPKWEQRPRTATKLARLIKELWDQSEFTSAIGIGKAAKNRIPRTVRFGREFFVP